MNDQICFIIDAKMEGWQPLPVLLMYLIADLGKNPKIMTSEAKITGDINIPIGASCGFFSSFSGLYFPVNVLKTKSYCK